MSKYSDFYKTEFGKKILNREFNYVLKNLEGCKNVLSVGCGPGFLESKLIEEGKNVTCIDVSEEMTKEAPKQLNVVLGSAEEMNFENKSFDAVIYITSLEFIEDYKKAIKETVRVLKPSGKILMLMLNPKSKYFIKKKEKPGSYFMRITKVNLNEIEEFIKNYFSIETNYFLGIKHREIFDSNDPKLASLYVIKGVKR